MSVRLKQYDEKRWEVDVGVRLSSGQRYRERLFTDALEVGG